MEEVARFFSNPSVAQQFQQFSNPPVISLVKQTSPTKENVSVKGVTKSVHVVIKNTPFVVQLGLSCQGAFTQVMDFNHLALDVRLVYDTTAHKEVDYVKTKPLLFKSSVNERADQISLECKIRVLTSQHEDMFFRVKVRALDPRTQQDFSPPLEMFSDPIKVISKPEQLKKRPAPKKRTMNDVLMEQISRITSQLDQQQKMLTELSDERATKKQRLICDVDENDENELLCIDDQPFSKKKLLASETSKMSKDESGLKSTDFVNTFTEFLGAYNSMPSEEKATTVRKLIRTSSARDTERLSELIDLFASEGLQKQIGNAVFPNPMRENSEPSSPSGFGCSCSNCPYRLELEQIESVSTSLFNPSIIEGATLERLLYPS